MKLIVDKKVSDPITFGNSEQLVPKDPSLESRIIRFAPRLDQSMLSNHFQTFGTLRPEDLLGITLLAYVDDFTKALEERLPDCTVTPYTYIPNGKRSIQGIDYQFGADGKIIRAHQHGEAVTIPRLVQVSQGTTDHYLLFCFKVGAAYPNYCNMVIAAKNLLREPYTLSIIQTYPIEVFAHDIAHPRTPPSHLQRYLEQKTVNLALVLSIRTREIQTLAQASYGAKPF